MNLGPSPRHAGSVSLIIYLYIAMLSPQFHINHDDFLETVRPEAGNPPTYSNWKAFPGLMKHYQSVRGPINTAPQRYERPKAVIARKTQLPPNSERGEE